MLAAAAGLHVVRKMNPKEKRDERYSTLRLVYVSFGTTYERYYTYIKKIHMLSKTMLSLFGFK